METKKDVDIPATRLAAAGQLTSLTARSLLFCMLAGCSSGCKGEDSWSH